jgi:rod shape-determining protein MreD
MIGTVIANLFRFVLLGLLQALLVDHIDVANSWVVPYLYVLALLMLPLNTPNWATLVIGFLTGLVMDLFSSTPGMHASACTVMAYARIFMLRALAPREGYDPLQRATVADMGLAWFITYAGMLVLVHHLWLFYVEVFRFDDFFAVLLRCIVSAMATLLLCLMAQLLMARAARNRIR